MISIDVTSRDPIYQQICKCICAEISKGVYATNDRLPASRTLAKELRLNPNTVAKAYGILEREGIIYSVAGKGSFVSEKKDHAEKKLTEDFERIVTEALKQGVAAKSLADRIFEIEKRLNE